MVVVDRYLLCRVWLGVRADVALTGVVGLRTPINCRLLAWFPAMLADLVVVVVVTVAVVVDMSAVVW